MLAPSKPVLPAAVEKSLIAALSEAELASEAREAIDAALPAGVSRATLLWDLAMRGKLPLANRKVAWVFDEPAPSVDALVTVWSKLDPKKALADVPQQWRGAPSWMFTVTGGAIKNDAAPWRARVSELKEPLRGVVWLELVECAHDKLPEKVRVELAQRIVKDAFGKNIVSSAENLEILGVTPADISARLLKKLPKELPPLDKLQPILVGSSVADLVKILLKCELSALVDKAAPILRARKDTPDELVAIGKTIAAKGKGSNVDFWKQMIAEVILERCAETKTTPPKAVDELLTLRWDDDSAEAPASLATMPAARLRARVARLMTSKEFGSHQALSAIAHCFDAALYQRAITLVCKRVADRDTYNANYDRVALGHAGKPAIAVLERALAKVSGKHAADHTVTLRTALLVANVIAARTTGKLDVDVLLPYPEVLDDNRSDAPFASKYFEQGLALVPVAKAKKIIRAWLDADKTGRFDVNGSIRRALSANSSHLLETRIERLERMAKETKLPRTQRIYVMERDKEADPKTHNRIASKLRGIAPPRHGKKPMEHVLTLDLDDAPELRKLSPSLAKARGVALFISSLRNNSAYKPDTKETAVVPLDENQLAAGHEALDSDSFRVHALDVPAEVFGPNPRVAGLRTAIQQLPCRALGAPTWIQDAEVDDDDVLLQLDDQFVPDLNLGDAGLMYVFSNTAFWQCH